MASFMYIPLVVGLLLLHYLDTATTTFSRGQQPYKSSLFHVGSWISVTHQHLHLLFWFINKPKPQPDSEPEGKKTMGFTESSLLLPSGSGIKNIPQDKWQLAYIVYFTLGLGYLLPWNAFITAVDYFSYLYPDASVDRIFAVVYMLIGLIGIFLIILYSHKSDAYVRINVGLALFVVSLLIVSLVDAFYVQGRVGFYGGFYITAGAVGLSGVADALVQGSIIGQHHLMTDPVTETGGISLWFERKREREKEDG